MTMRITGLNSGLDIDSIVKQSMQTHQNKIDKEVQNKKVLEYKQEQYKEIMKDATDFYDKYLDRAKSGNLMMTSSYNTVAFKSVDETKVSAKGFAGAEISDYKVSITQLAEKASHSISTTDLENCKNAKKGVISVKMDGKEIFSDVALDKDGNLDIQATVDNLNFKLDKKNIKVDAKYSEFSKGIKLESLALGEDINFELAIQDGISVEGIEKKTDTFTTGYTTYEGKNAKGTITKGNESYDIDKNSNIVNVDNVQFALKGVTTEQSSQSKYLTSETVGEILKDHIKKIEELADRKIYTLSDDSKIEVGKDGSLAFSDKSGTKVNSLKVTNLDGSEITLNDDATVSFGNVDNAVNLTGSSDTKEIKDKLINFINDYNKLIEGINKKIFETRDRDYMPLTDEQKEAMSEDQVKAWEEKAKTGLLRKDSDLQRIASEMKSAMSLVMSSSGLSLDRIGIEPVKNYTDKNGMFTIDEEKLSKSLEENASSVKELLIKPSVTEKNPITGKDEVIDEGGVFTRLKDALNKEFVSVMSPLAKKAGTTASDTSSLIYKNIEKQKKLISQLQRDYVSKEDALYRKYAAFETALESMNAQQTSLSQMLGQ